MAAGGPVDAWRGHVVGLGQYVKVDLVLAGIAAIAGRAGVEAAVLRQDGGDEEAGPGVVGDVLVVDSHGAPPLKLELDGDVRVGGGAGDGGGLVLHRLLEVKAARLLGEEVYFVVDVHVDRSVCVNR